MFKPLSFILSLAFLQLISINGISQQQFSIATGISIDVNNNGKFKQIPFSFQWMPGKSSKSRFFIKTEIAFPLKNISYDSAYTLSGNLPHAITERKEITCNWFTIDCGVRFYIPVDKKEQSLFIDWEIIGVTSQIFKVKYSGDNGNNYEVLNPDVNLYRGGLIAGIGFGYIKNSFVIQSHIQTPPLTPSSRYKRTFIAGAPLEVTVGYLFFNPKHKK
jgi:hypothetical protein